MNNYQNHLVDPTFFWDIIEEFSFDYDWYVVKKGEVDLYGNTVTTYDHQTIRGSLQSNGKRHSRSTDGNTDTFNYDFYCKSLYRIDIDDIIEYKNNYFIVEAVHDFDEYGVRHVELNMISLTAYRDFSDYLKYLRGEKFV